MFSNVVKNLNEPSVKIESKPVSVNKGGSSCTVKSCTRDKTGSCIIC